MWRGTGGREPGSKVGGKSTGGGRREGGKRDFQGGNRKKNSQHCVIFYNRKKTKRREPRQKGQEPGVQGTRSGKFIPLPPPPYNFSLLINLKRQTSCIPTIYTATWFPFTVMTILFCPVSVGRCVTIVLLDSLKISSLDSLMFE